MATIDIYRAEHAHDPLSTARLSLLPHSQIDGTNWWLDGGSHPDKIQLTQHIKEELEKFLHEYQYCIPQRMWELPELSAVYEAMHESCVTVQGAEWSIFESMVDSIFMNHAKIMKLSVWPALSKPRGWSTTNAMVLRVEVPDADQARYIWNPCRRVDTAIRCSQYCKRPKNHNNKLQAAVLRYMAVLLRETKELDDDQRVCAVTWCNVCLYMLCFLRLTMFALCAYNRS